MYSIHIYLVQLLYYLRLKLHLDMIDHMLHKLRNKFCFV